MTGLELKTIRKKHKLTQEDLANKLGLERKTIIGYEKMSVIPEKKCTLLYNFFNTSKNIDVYLEKEGVKISIQEMATFFVNNEEACLENKTYKKVINSLASELANKELKEIYMKQNLKQNNH